MINPRKLQYKKDMKDFKFLADDLGGFYDEGLRKATNDFLNKNLPEDVKKDIQNEKGIFSVSVATDFTGKFTNVSIHHEGFSPELSQRIDALINKPENKLE